MRLSQVPFGALTFENVQVFNTKDLLRQADMMISVHGGCLIEEFVEDREFTVLVAENPDDPRTPVAYQAVECRFPPGEEFKHFDLKWHDFDGMAWVPPPCRTRSWTHT